MPSVDTAVAWLERDYDMPGRFTMPAALMMPRGFFQVKDDHDHDRDRDCGWSGCGNERERLVETIKRFAEVTQS